ncbi:MAG: M57 family metalloprotease [Thermoanaerobaculia bacterium]
MIAALRSFLVSALVVAFAAPVFALTYIVPSDAEMIQRSDDIVVAVGVASTVERSLYDGIVTRYTLRIEEVLKGDRAPSQYLVVTELGGQLGDMVDIVPGRPEYYPGERYLIFTETNREGDPITFGYALGQFHLRKTKERELAIRGEIHGFDGNLDSFVDRGRDAVAFRRFIRETVAGRYAQQNYFISAEELRNAPVVSLSGFAASSYVSDSTSSGLPWRWPNPSYSFVISQDQPGSDEAAAVATALAEWNFTGTDISLGNAGRDDAESCSICSSNFDGVNVVEFNVASLPGGAAGQARFGGGGTHKFPAGTGEDFINIVEGDVLVLGSSFQQCVVDSIVTHEIGHTLGFRHSNEGKAGLVCGSTAECTSDAIMNFSVGCTNGALRPYDQTAATAVYGDGVVVCNAPTISTHPQDKNVSIGAQTTLTVVAGGTGPFTYQWFFGTSGDTSNLVTGATSSSLNITPTSAGVGSYWVRVGHACDALTVNSNTATVTATCTNPAITAPPASTSINAGQSTQLQVTATGSSLAYQWYRGESGDTSNPVGTNSNKLTVTPDETTKYWVRVSGACGTPADSPAATVTVVPCAEITVNPPTSTQLPGVGNFSITVSATSASTPLTYTWFRGGTPGFGGTSLGPGQTKTVNVTVVTGFWARIQNGCGRVEFSTLLTLAPCTLPTITTQPQDQTINSGQNASLSIAVSVGATVKWYRGLVGDKTNQAGAAASVSVGPLTANTQYWAEVTNTCGAISSRQVTVTVRQLSDLVPMLNARFFVQVRYRNQFDNGQEGQLLGRSLFSSTLSETAVFTFGDQNVVELLVRVSDARPFDDNIHIFLGGLSDVEFFVVVTDSLSGIVNEYHKPANELVGVIDRTTFPASNSLQDGLDTLSRLAVGGWQLAGGPRPTPSVNPNAEVSTIRLLNRFDVRMRYRNQFTNPAGEGYMNTRSIASSPTTETAVFFFDANVGSAEWIVRFSDARPFAERIDLFHGGLSDVEFTLEVTDTKTGAYQEYQKDPFSLLGEVDRDSYQP